MNRSARSFESYFAGLSANTFLLAASSLFGDISTEMLYPVLPIFLIETLGASASLVGIVEGVAPAVQNIAQGFSGWLSDRRQRRKAIALFGFALAAVAKPLNLGAFLGPLIGLGNSSNAFLILRTKGLGASLTTTILIYAFFNLVAALASWHENDPR